MSQHKRNIEGMQNAQRQKIESSILRVEAVIQEMLLNKHTITFNRIANQANVSKAWLYRQSDLCTKIKALRSQNKNFKKPVLQSEIDTRDAIISSLKARLKKLDLENSELRKQLEVLYGELHLKKI